MRVGGKSVKRNYIYFFKINTQYDKDVTWKTLYVIMFLYFPLAKCVLTNKQTNKKVISRSHDVCYSVKRCNAITTTVTSLFTNYLEQRLLQGI